MDVSASSWLVILLALLGANAPFLNQRLLLLIPLPRRVKNGWLRIVEMGVYYFLIGFLGRALEGNIGNVAPQNWEFYAITVCLFIVLAFPGFVYCYLVKRRT